MIKNKFKSKKFASFTIWLLRVEIMFSVLSMLCYLLLLPSGSQVRPYLRDMTTLLSVGWIVLIILFVFCWPIWMFLFHGDLSKKFSGYPIRPWKTILAYLLPWYSIWGMTNISKVLSDRIFLEEIEEFEAQPYYGLDPRYQAWVLLLIFNLTENKKLRSTHGARLLKLFTTMYFLWFISLYLFYVGLLTGFGWEINLIAPTIFIFFHNILFSNPVFIYELGHPDTMHILFVFGFTILFSMLLIQIVKGMQKSLEK